MGIETILFMAFTGLQAVSGMMNAQSQADAAVKQGNLQMAEKAKQVRYATARQNVSFLNSGLSLEGTPMDVINETFDTGIKDIQAIGANANAQSKNIIGQARTQAIGQIAGAFGGMGGGGGGFGGMATAAGSYLPDTALFSLNKAGFGNDAFSMMEMKDTRGGSWY